MFSIFFLSICRVLLYRGYNLSAIKHWAHIIYNIWTGVRTYTAVWATHFFRTFFACFLHNFRIRNHNFFRARPADMCWGGQEISLALWLGGVWICAVGSLALWPRYPRVMGSEKLAPRLAAMYRSVHFIYKLYSSGSRTHTDGLCEPSQPFDFSPAPRHTYSYNRHLPSRENCGRSFMPLRRWCALDQDTWTSTLLSAK